MKSLMPFLTMSITFITFLLQPMTVLPFPNVEIIKISPEDETAVIKVDQGDLMVISKGDLISQDCKVISIAEDKVVIEDGTDHKKETVIITLENEKQKTAKVLNRAKKVSLPSMPVTINDK